MRGGTKLTEMCPVKVIDYTGDLSVTLEGLKERRLENINEFRVQFKLKACSELGRTKRKRSETRAPISWEKHPNRINP